MGTSTSWIAVEGATIEQVARELDLAVTPAAPGAIAADCDVGAYHAAMLPSGWVLLVYRMEDDGVVAGPALLEKLSRGRRVVGCDEESHVMYAASCEWRDGREVWAVVHAASEVADHLDASGTLPAGWIETRDAWLAEQADEDAKAPGPDRVDYVYEIPLVIAKLVAGYRLETDDDDALTFVKLVGASTPAPGPAKPWWKVW